VDGSYNPLEEQKDGTTIGNTTGYRIYKKTKKHQHIKKTS